MAVCKTDYFVRRIVANIEKKLIKEPFNILVLCTHSLDSGYSASGIGVTCLKNLSFLYIRHVQLDSNGPVSVGILSTVFCRQLNTVFRYLMLYYFSVQLCARKCRNFEF